VKTALKSNMSATQGDVQCSPKCSDEQISLSDKCLFFKEIINVIILFIYLFILIRGLWDLSLQPYAH